MVRDLLSHENDWSMSKCMQGRWARLQFYYKPDCEAINQVVGFSVQDSVKCSWGWSIPGFDKAFTSGLGLDALSLALHTVVQLVVSFNSGLQRGISQEYCFFVSSQWWFDFVLSLRRIELESHYANQTFHVFFVLRITGYIRTQGEVCTVKGL